MVGVTSSEAMEQMRGRVECREGIWLLEADQGHYFIRGKEADQGHCIREKGREY